MKTDILKDTKSACQVKSQVGMPMDARTYMFGLMTIGLRKQIEKCKIDEVSEIVGNDRARTIKRRRLTNLIQSQSLS